MAKYNLVKVPILGQEYTVNTLASPEYNVVSGSIADGVHTAAADMTSATGSYGSFYPKLGVILLNPIALGGGVAAPLGTNGSAILGIPTVTGSNADNRNALTFFKSIKSGSYFQTKREEVKRFESKSSPGLFYTVKRTPTNGYECDCPGFKFQFFLKIKFIYFFIIKL